MSHFNRIHKWSNSTVKGYNIVLYVNIGLKGGLSNMISFMTEGGVAKYILCSTFK